MKPRSGKRGIRVIALLLVAVVLTGGAVATIAVPALSSSRSSGFTDPLKQARRAFAEMDFAKAEEILRAVASPTTGSLSAKLLLARTLLERGRLRDADAVLAAILKEHPKNLKAHLVLGELQIKARQYRQAVRTLKQAAELDPKSARVWRLLGMAQYQGGDSIGSLFSFRKSLAALPGQEDLSQLMTQIGTARSGQSVAGRNRQPGSRDPFSQFGGRDPRRFGPSVPQPQIPDPLRDLPIPGRRRR